MLLAELEVFHTRPLAPTRRLSLGNLVLPVDPAPGLGGLLLGAVVAGHIDAVGRELVADVHRLIDQVARGDRVVQPRLRHRFQTDRHGLGRSIHRLVGIDNEISFDFETNGSGLAQVLAAVYALERLDGSVREPLGNVLHRSVTWRGPVGPRLIGYLVGTASVKLSTMANPKAWALDILGFPPGTSSPSRKEVLARFRTRMRSVHPDHGGDIGLAASAMTDLNEARRILADATR